MPLSREYLREKVKQAIKQLPSTGIVVREALNKYNEKEGYFKVAELSGVLYNNTTNRSFDISINNSGVDIDTNDKSFKVNELGENLKIYCLMQLTKNEGLKLEGDNIIFNDIVYPLLTLPKGWLNEY